MSTSVLVNLTPGLSPEGEGAYGIRILRSSLLPLKEKEPEDEVALFTFYYL